MSCHSQIQRRYCNTYYHRWAADHLFTKPTRKLSQIKVKVMPSSDCTIFKVVRSLFFSHCMTILATIQSLLCSAQRAN